jgi:hypothetical protein
MVAAHSQHQQLLKQHLQQQQQPLLHNAQHSPLRVLSSRPAILMRACALQALVACQSQGSAQQQQACIKYSSMMLQVNMVLLLSCTPLHHNNILHS